MYPKSDPGSAMGVFFGERVDPLSSMCLGQRATNESMLRGLLFQCGIDRILDVNLPESTRAACLALTIEARINIAAGLVSNALDPVLATSTAPPDLLAALKRDAVRISAWASFRAVKDPDGTDLAESAYTDETAPVGFRGLLGVPKNAVAMNSSPPAVTTGPP